MRHCRQQRSVQPTDDKAPDVKEGTQFPAYLSSRRTPSPEAPPPAPRLGHDKGANVEGTSFATNLLDLYRSTDIAKVGDCTRVVEGKSSDNGGDESEDGSRGLPECFEESTSHVVTVTGFSEKDCNRSSEDEDEDLLAACSLAEGLQASEGPSNALFVEARGRLSASASSLEQALYPGEPDFFASDAVADTLTATWQHTESVTAANEKEDASGEKIGEGDLDSKASYAREKQRSRVHEVDCEATAAVADDTEANGTAPSWSKAVTYTHTVAAVRRRSLLTGCIAASGISLAALACVSPWNVEFASFCIVTGMFLSILGWLAPTFKTQLWLTLHSILLFCFLIVVAISIVLTFHWAVQSFRALCHAYFDDTFSPKNGNPVGLRGPHFTVPADFPISHRTPLRDAPLTAAAADSGGGSAYDDTTTMLPSTASTAAHSKIPSVVDVTKEAKAGMPAAIAADEAQPHRRLLHSDSLYVPTASTEPLQLLRGCQHLANAVIGGSSSGRQRQYAENRSEAVQGDAFESEPRANSYDTTRKGSSLSSPSLTMLHISQAALSSGTVGNTVQPVASTRRCPGGDPQTELTTTSYARNVLELSQRGSSNADEPPDVKITCLDETPPCGMEDNSQDSIKPSVREEQNDTSKKIQAGMDKGDRQVSTHAGLPQLHSGQKGDLMQPLSYPSAIHASEGSVVLTRVASSFKVAEYGAQKPMKALPSTTRSAETPGRSPVSLPCSSSGAFGEPARFNELQKAADTNVHGIGGPQASLQQLNVLIDTSQSMPGAHSLVSVVPSISCCVTMQTAEGRQEATSELQENIVNPEPARCEHLSGGLLKYVHSTRRQLETYGMLCAFSRYDLWGIFDRWSVDCETGCGFRFLATKRYMWSKSPADSAGAFTSAVSGAGRPHFDQQAPKAPSKVPPLSAEAGASPLPPKTAASVSASYLPLEYLHWHAALPPAEQKACLEGALNVACSVVKNHYLMLLPPLAVLLLIISLIVMGVGTAALRSTLRLRRLAARTR